MRLHYIIIPLFFLAAAFFLFSSKSKGLSGRHAEVVSVVKMFVKDVLVVTGYEHLDGVVGYSHHSKIVRGLHLRRIEGDQSSSVMITVNIDLDANEGLVEVVQQRGDFQNNIKEKINIEMKKLEVALVKKGFKCTLTLLKILPRKHGYFPLSKLVFDSSGCEQSSLFSITIKDHIAYLEMIENSVKVPQVHQIKITKSLEKRINWLINDFKVYQSKEHELESTSTDKLILFDLKNKEILNIRNSSGDYGSETASGVEKDDFYKLAKDLFQEEPISIIGTNPLGLKLK